MQIARRIPRALAALALAFGAIAVTAAPAAADVTDPVLVPGAPETTYRAVAYKGELYVAAPDGADIGFFHVADGTSTRIGTVDEPRNFVEYGGILYFSGDNGSETVLYSFDGTNLAPVAGSPTDLFYLSVYDGELIMTGDNALNERAVFTFDGVLPPFFEEFDIPVNTTSASFVAEYDGVMYLSILEPGTFALYEFDGTAVTAVPGYPEFARAAVVFDGLLYMEAESVPTVLYSYDGTDFVELTGVPDDSRGLYVHDGRLYLSIGPDGVLGTLEGGTATPLPGAPEDAFNLASFDGDLFFSAGPEGVLTRFDGAAFQTFPGVYSLNDGFSVIGDTAYFTAADEPGMEDSHLWSLTVAPDPALAATGTSPVVPLGIAAALLAAGGFALVWRRRAASTSAV